MKKSLKFTFLALALTQFFTGICQSNIEVSYFKDVSKSKPVNSREKAKYEEIKTELEDNFITIEFKRISDGQLISYRAHKNNIPHGVWKYYKSDGSWQITDYDFELNYSKEKIENAVYFNFATGEMVSKNLENTSAPKFIGKASNSQAMLYKSIRYPEYAKNHGIMGEVKVQIKIDAEGKLTVVSIFESVEGSLDKEAARGLRECQGWEPAKINGQNVDSYSIVTVKFRLE